MAKKIVAIAGTYRRGGTVDTAVDALLSAAEQEGIEIEKILLLDRHIEFCTNCRACTQHPGPQRGACPLNDDVDGILDKLEAADGIVLASPINFGNVTAIMKRFIERLVCYGYWPWDVFKPPQMRIKKPTKPAVLITSSTCPAFIGRWLMSNPLKTMKAAAKCLRAKPVGTLYFGSVGVRKAQTLDERQCLKARQQGTRLARAL